MILRGTMVLSLEALVEFNTIGDFLRYGMTQAKQHQLVYGHGTDNPFDDIWTLIAGTLALPIDSYTTFLQARLTKKEKTILIEQLKQRIVHRKPVPYLLKEAYFCRLSFYVDERVLIPRSPIAELIQQQFSPWIDPQEVAHILDLCTGSGCIAIACGYAFPDATIDATDLSSDALDVAKINAKRHSLEESVHFIQSNVWEAVPVKHYDLIIANPPYVGDNEMRTLPKEYHYEPKMALRADHDGLSIVNKILTHAHEYLSHHGILVVEVGNTQDTLIEAYPHIPFTWLEFEHGGQGVFLLTYEQLVSVKEKK